MDAYQAQCEADERSAAMRTTPAPSMCNGGGYVAPVLSTSDEIMAIGFIAGCAAPFASIGGKAIAIAAMSWFARRR